MYTLNNKNKNSASTCIMINQMLELSITTKTMSAIENEIKKNFFNYEIFYNINLKFKKFLIISWKNPKFIINYKVASFIFEVIHNKYQKTNYKFADKYSKENINNFTMLCNNLS